MIQVDKWSMRQNGELEIDPTQKTTPGETRQSSNHGAEIAGHLQAKVTLDIHLKLLKMNGQLMCKI